MPPTQGSALWDHEGEWGLQVSRHEQQEGEGKDRKAHLPCRRDEDPTPVPCLADNLCGSQADVRTIRRRMSALSAQSLFSRCVTFVGQSLWFVRWCDVDPHLHGTCVITQTHAVRTPTSTLPTRVYLRFVPVFAVKSTVV